MAFYGMPFHVIFLMIILAVLVQLSVQHEPKSAIVPNDDPLMRLLFQKVSHDSHNQIKRNQITPVRIDKNLESELLIRKQKEQPRILSPSWEPILRMAIRPGLVRFSGSKPTDPLSDPLEIIEKDIQGKDRRKRSSSTSQMYSSKNTFGVQDVCPSISDWVAKVSCKHLFLPKI